MPVPTVISSIVTSIVTSAIEAALNAPGLPPQPEFNPLMLRTFPAETRRGELAPPEMGLGPLSINGRELPRAPGLQIRNEYNMIVMPGMVQKQVPVRYRVDLTGAVSQVWVLTAAEAAVPEAASDSPQR